MVLVLYFFRIISFKKLGLKNFLLTLCMLFFFKCKCRLLLFFFFKRDASGMPSEFQIVSTQFGPNCKGKQQASLVAGTKLKQKVVFLYNDYCS